MIGITFFSNLLRSESQNTLSIHLLSSFTLLVSPASGHIIIPISVCIYLKIQTLPISKCPDDLSWDKLRMGRLNNIEVKIQVDSKYLLPPTKGEVGAGAVWCRPYNPSILGKSRHAAVCLHAWWKRSL